MSGLEPEAGGLGLRPCPWVDAPCNGGKVVHFAGWRVALGEVGGHKGPTLLGALEVLVEVQPKAEVPQELQIFGMEDGLLGAHVGSTSLGRVWEGAVELWVKRSVLRG